jgi:type I restriction enzyme, S subunit
LSHAQSTIKRYCEKAAGFRRRHPSRFGCVGGVVGMKIKSECPIITLGKLAEKIDYGFTASATDVGNGPKFLRITDIQDDQVNWSTVPLCEADEQDKTKYALAGGDIVFARTGATTGKSYLIHDCPENSIFASYLIRVRPSKDVDPEYLSRFFQTPNYWRQINLNTSGTAQGGVNASKLKTLLVPLPPLEEQRRIAAILDKADAVRRKRKEAIALTEDLLRSSFLEMFGDPVTNPKGWEICKMKQIVKDTQYGTAEKSNEDGNGLPVLRMNNITYSGEIILDSLKWCAISSKDEEKFTVKRGDLLFNRTNSPELVGKTAIWKSEKKFAFAGYLVRVRFDEAKVTPEYVSAYLNSNYGKKYILEKAKPSINMSNFSASEFLKIPIPLPNIEVQHRFVELVNGTGFMAESLKTSIGAYNNLFNSLLQRAFRGEL